LVVKAVTRGVVGFGVVGATNLSAPVDEHADPRHAILSAPVALRVTVTVFGPSYVYSHFTPS